MKISCTLVLIIISTLMITACGGGNSSTPTPQSVSITVSPTNVDLVGSATQQFTATVSGSSNHAVTWSLTSSGCSGSACGTISSSGMYTAPNPVSANMTVNIVATAAADTTKTATATANLTPVSISLSPSTASVYQQDMVKFTANITGALDPSITWDVSGVVGGDSSHGYIWPSGMYTTVNSNIPTTPQTFTITAKSNADSTKSATAQVTVTGTAPNNSKMSGNYALLFQGYDNDGPIALAGHFNADSAGGIGGGVLALNSLSNTSLKSGSGSYSIGSDNRGTMSLAGWTFRFVVNSAGNMRIVSFDETSNPIRGSGEIKKQDATAFSLNTFSGAFAMGLSGDLNGSEMALLGQLTWDNTGTLTGAVDYVPAPTNPHTYPTTGTLTSPDPLTGHGNTALIPAGIPLTTPMLFDYFVVSSTEAFVIQSTTRSTNVPALSGVLMKQSGGPFTNATLNGATVFQLTGTAPEGSHVLLGQAVFDGNGNVTGVADENFEGSVTANNSFNGTYQVCDNLGCGTIQNITFNSGTSAFFTFYLISPGKAFIAGGTKLSNKVMTGTLEPQTGGTFTLKSIAGTYAMGTLAPATASVSNVSATATLGSSGSFNGMQDVWTVSGPYLSEAMDGTFTLTDATAGRGTITPCAMCGAVPFYIVSPTKLLEMEWTAGDDVRIQAYEQ
jgi:hypothetical protein